MSAPVMLPLATPRLLRELVEGLPTSPARRKGRIEVAKLEAGFTLLRAGVPPEDEARLLLEVASDLVALARPIFEMPALTRVMLASASEMIADAGAKLRQRLGTTIAGAAAEFSLRSLRSFLMFAEATLRDLDIERLAQLEAAPIETLIDMNSFAGDLLRGELFALVLCDAEDGGDYEGMERLACRSAIGFLRSFAHPALRQVPDPWLGETDQQRDQRHVHMLKLAPTAASQLEREVILALRVQHFRGSDVGVIAGYVSNIYRDLLRRLA